MGKRTITLAGLCATACLAAPALAQSTTAAETATPPSDGDIVVTARKRAEALQDVPVSIGVATAETIAKTGTTSLLQIQSIAPGLNLAKAPTGNEIGVTIRGLGSAPGDSAFDSSVSLFIDGVYAPRSREFASALFDVERVEVIRGTQAALLGKNTSLGAINLVTRKPGDSFALELRGGYDLELKSRVIAGGMDIPLGATLALRVSGQSTFDGGSTLNTISRRKNPRRYDDAIRAVLRWQPSDAFDATAYYQYSFGRDTGTPSEFIAANPVAALLQGIAGAPNTLDFALDRRNATYIGATDGEQTARLRVHRGGLTMNLDLGGPTLTSVTSYSTFKEADFNDLDFQAGNFLNRTLDENSRQFSQEVRLVSPGRQTFDYVIGGLYLDNNLRNASVVTAAYPFGPPQAPTVPIAGAFRNSFDQQTKAVSLFAQGTLRVAEGFRLLGGLRYTNERKSVDFARTVLVPGLFSVAIYPPYAPFTLKRTENNVDFSGGLQVDLAPDVLAYASYGQGTKSGGFATSVTFLDQSPYNAERARTAEVGIKSQFADRTVTLNVSAFSTNVDNFQVVTFNGLAFTVANADLQSRGFELEASWRPVRGVRLFLSNTYADAKDRRTGAPIPLAPSWSGSAGFDVRTPIAGSIDGLVNGSVDYRSSRYYQQDPNAVPPGAAFTTLNLSAAIADHEERWELRVIGRNLTDANAAAFVFPTPIIGGPNGISERGRSVMVQGTVRFR